MPIIPGNDFDNLLTGTDLIDFILAKGGDDVVYARQGTDTVWAGSGDDTVFGEDGNDVIHGESGDNSLFGGDHSDIIYSGTDDDYIDGGSGKDLASWKNADAPVYAALNDAEEGWAYEAFDGFPNGYYEPDDTLVSIENLQGSAHDDRLVGNSGNNELFGEGGDDVLIGLGGDDYVNAGAGNDKVEGGDGSDTLRGGFGNDEIDAGGGRGNVVFGEAGFDTLTFASMDTGVLVVNYADGVGQSSNGTGGYWLNYSGIEQIVGSSHADDFNGHDGTDNFYGGRGDDTFHSSGGNDFLVGDGGRDTFYFANGSGHDKLGMTTEDVINLRSHDAADGWSSVEDVFENSHLVGRASIVIELGDDSIMLNRFVADDLTDANFIF